MSRVRYDPPIPVPVGRRRRPIDGAPRHGEGPEGLLDASTSPATSPSARTDDTLARRAPRRRAREPGAARAHPLAGQQHGRRRHRGLHARTSRSSASATAPRRRARQARAGRSASATRSRSTHPRASPSRCRRRRGSSVQGHRQGARRPGRRRHPQDPQARALQGQGRPLRRRARAPQGREGSEVSDHRAHSDKRRGARVRRHRRVRKKVRGHRRAAAPRGVPLEQAHLRPGHRRPHRSHARRGLDDRGRPARAGATGNGRRRHARSVTLRRRAGQGRRRRPGRVRPRRVPVPRPRGRGRRRRPRSRLEF